MDAGAGQLVAPPSSEERWLWPQWPPPRRGVALACLIAAGLHVALVFGTDWFDRAADRAPTTAEEIPVEVVEEPEPASQPQDSTPAPPTQSPAAAVTPPAPAPAAPRPPAEEAAAPQPPPVPQPPAPAEQTAAPSPRPVEVEVSRGSVTGAPTNDPTAGEAQQEAPPPPAASVDAPAEAPPYPSEQAAATAQHIFVPQTFRGAALPGATVQSQDSYKSLVYGMLERAKRLPARTPSRNGVLAAYVRFMLDRGGNILSLSLIGSSGDAELDAEALALVRRAAPFPKPPLEGTLLTFTPIIVFGYDE